MTVREDERRQWHVLREIPVALLLGIGIQTLGFAWWLSGLNKTVEQQSKDIASIVIRLDSISSQVHGSSVPMALQAARMASLEQQISELRARASEDDRREDRRKGTR